MAQVNTIGIRMTRERDDPRKMPLRIVCHVEVVRWCCAFFSLQSGEEGLLDSVACLRSAMRCWSMFTFRHTIWINDLICSRSIGQRAAVRSTWKRKIEKKACVATSRLWLESHSFHELDFEVCAARNAYDGQCHFMYLIFPSVVSGSWKSNKNRQQIIRLFKRIREHVFSTMWRTLFGHGTDDRHTSQIRHRKSITLNTQL